MKSFFRLRRSSNAGFTLIELIVVIAIIAILAAAGTVVYSKYIEKANIAADEQLIADIRYALAIGANSENAKDYNGYVVIQKNADGEATCSIVGNNLLDQYMTDAFGADWKKTLRLKSDGTEVGTDSLSSNMLLQSALKGDDGDKNVRQEYAKAVAKSNIYGQGSENLAGDVAALTQAAAEALTGNTGSNYVGALEGLTVNGEDALRLYESSKYESSKDATRANLLVWAAAKEIGGSDSETWEKMAAQFANTEKEGDKYVAFSGEPSLSNVVLAYAKVYALAKVYDAANGLGPGEEGGMVTTLNEDVATAGNGENKLSAVINTINDKYETMMKIAKQDPEGELNQYLTGGGLANDAKAFISTMGALSDNAQSILNDHADLSKGDYFQQSDVVDSLDNLKTISELVDGGFTGGVIVTLIVDREGNVKVS